MSTSSAPVLWPGDTGLLLIGHGSPEHAATSEFLATAAIVAGMHDVPPVEPCFLEFARPAIADGFGTLVRRGAKRVVVVPVLLFSAAHAKRDIPAAVAAVAADHPGVDVIQSDHLGCHRAILELSRLRLEEALAENAGAALRDATLVIVGRGSHDPRATAEMRRFVKLRADESRTRDARTCFVAMAEPRLPAVLDEAARGGARSIIVQPHLLFGGVLVDRIRQTVEQYAVRYPRLRWTTTRHLGPSQLVARATLCRAQEKLSCFQID